MLFYIKSMFWDTELKKSILKNLCFWVKFSVCCTNHIKCHEKIKCIPFILFWKKKPKPLSLKVDIFIGRKWCELFNTLALFGYCFHLLNKIYFWTGIENEVISLVIHILKNNVSCLLEAFAFLLLSTFLWKVCSIVY